MGVSNKITAFLNFVALLSSISIISAGIWFSTKSSDHCIHQFRYPVTLLGILVLFASLTGFIGAYWNKKCLLIINLFFLATLIALLLILLVFAFIVTRPEGSYSTPVSGGFREFRLKGFSSWLRNHITNSRNWNKIRICLTESDICLKLNQDYVTADQFFVGRISPIQSGCCKPPTACGYTFVNPITWTSTGSGASASDPGCYIWNNDPNQLCYNCDSCRAGVLEELRRDWKKVNVILIVATVFLISLYLVACSAFRNAQTEDLFRRYKQGWT